MKKYIFIALLCIVPFTVFSNVTSNNPIDTTAVPSDNFNGTDVTNDNEDISYITAHTKAVLWTQYFSSILIFIIVLLMVSFGFWMAYKHFELYLKDKKGVVTNHGKGDSISNDTTIEAVGFKIKTPYIGLAILFISLLFFFLYLKYVFPISYVK